MTDRRHLCEVLQDLDAPLAFVAWSRRYGCAWTQAIYACPLSEWLVWLAGRLHLYEFMPGSALAGWACACWQLLVDLEVPETDDPRAWAIVESARIVARDEIPRLSPGDAMEIAARVTVGLFLGAGSTATLLAWSCAGLLAGCATRRSLMRVVQESVEAVGDLALGEEVMEARVRAVTKRELGALILDALERSESVRRAAGTEGARGV